MLNPSRVIAEVHYEYVYCYTHTLHFIISGFTGAFWDAIQTFLSALLYTKFSTATNEKAGIHFYIQSSLSHLQ